MRIVTYTRYSTDNQDLTSITDQERTISRWMEREGCNLVTRYSDPALSGQYADRPDYNRLKLDAEQRRFDGVVVDEISRLWRDVAEQYAMVELFRYLGIHIIGVNDGIDTRRAGYELLLAVKGAQNEDFIRFVSKKVHNSLSGKVEARLHAGGKIYGYNSRYEQAIDKQGHPYFKPNGLEIDPDQAVIVRRIFELYAAGHPPARIANELNRQGIPSPRNRTWRGSAIYGHLQKGTGILSQELYIGRYIWNRSQWVKLPASIRRQTGRTGKKERRERPPEDWITVELPNLRIIDQALWDRVKARQARIHEGSNAIRSALHAGARPGRGPKYLFSGLLRCGVCGGNMIMISKYSYGCAANVQGGEHACSNRMRAPRRTLENRLLSLIRDEMGDPALLAEFRAEVIRLVKSQAQEQAPARDRLKADLARINQEIGNLLDAIQTLSASGALLGALAECESQKADLEAALAIAEKGVTVAAMVPNIPEMFRKTIGELETLLNTDTTAAREHIRGILGDDIRLIPDAEKGCLVAEIQPDYAGLFGLPGMQLNLVAGVGFGTYCYTPEPLRVPII